MQRAILTTKLYMVWSYLWVLKSFPQSRDLEQQKKFVVTKSPDSRHVRGMSHEHLKGMVELIFPGDTHPGDTLARSWPLGLGDGAGVLWQMAGRWGTATVVGMWFTRGIGCWTLLSDPRICMPNVFPGGPWGSGPHCSAVGIQNLLLVWESGDIPWLWHTAARAVSLVVLLLHPILCLSWVLGPDTDCSERAFKVGFAFW